jgi:DNA-binding NarL/FixJ family response regulator
MTDSLKVTKVSVLLADNHHILRQALKLLLEKHNCQVAGEASESGETIKLAVKLKPDVIVMDIEMRPANGLTVARRIADKFPSSKIVILSAHDAEQYVLDAFSAPNVFGYVVKVDSPEELVPAITTTSRGRLYMSRSVPSGVCRAARTLTRDRRAI